MAQIKPLQCTQARSRQTGVSKIGYGSRAEASFQDAQAGQPGAAVAGHRRDQVAAAVSAAAVLKAGISPGRPVGLSTRMMRTAANRGRCGNPPLARGDGKKAQRVGRRQVVRRGATIGCRARLGPFHIVEPPNSRNSRDNFNLDSTRQAGSRAWKHGLTSQDPQPG